MVIVDPSTTEFEHVREISEVASLTFVRDGEYLVVVGNDGDVRLWDVGNNESAGQLWDGHGLVHKVPSRYDESAETIWIATSGKLIRVPLDPASWIERACEVVDRDLTQQEWDRFVPGDQPRQSACGRPLVVDAGGSAPATQTVTTTEPTSPADDELAVDLVIEGSIDYDRGAPGGVFEVVEGAEILGCDAGRFDDVSEATIERTYVCESGDRTGTFTVELDPGSTAGPGDVNSDWEITGATGDLTDLVGGGRWSFFDQGTSGSDVLTGHIEDGADSNAASGQR